MVMLVKIDCLLAKSLLELVMPSSKKAYEPSAEDLLLASKNNKLTDLLFFAINKTMISFIRSITEGYCCTSLTSHIFVTSASPR